MAVAASDSPIETKGRSPTEVVSRAVLFVGLVAAAALAASPLLSHFVSHGLTDRARSTTLVALAILVPAGFLYAASAALAGSLGAIYEFGFSAASYAIASLIALTVSVIMLTVIGPLGSAVGVLVGSLILASSHLIKARALGIRIRMRLGWLRDAYQWRFAFQILAGASLGAALQVNLVISLGVVSAFSGGITAYSYGFFIASAILAVSALPLAIATLPDVASFRSIQRIADHLRQTARLGYMLATPLVAALIAFGEPVLAVAFEPFTSPQLADPDGDCHGDPCRDGPALCALLSGVRCFARVAVTRENTVRCRWNCDDSLRGDLDRFA